MRNNKVEGVVAVSKTIAIKYVYSCCYNAQKPLCDLKSLNITDMCVSSGS